MTPKNIMDFAFAICIAILFAASTFASIKLKSVQKAVLMNKHYDPVWGMVSGLFCTITGPFVYFLLFHTIYNLFDNTPSFFSIVKLIGAFVVLGIKAYHLPAYFFWLSNTIKDAIKEAKVQKRIKNKECIRIENEVLEFDKEVAGWSFNDYNIKMFNKSYDVKLEVASFSSNKPVLTRITEDSLRSFLDNSIRENNLKLVEDKLVEIYPDNTSNRFAPKTVLFKNNGEYSILFEDKYVRSGIIECTVLANIEDATVIIEPQKSCV